MSPNSNRATCPRCGAGFGCGADAPACWCTALPRIDPAELAALDAAQRAALGLAAGEWPASCFCPDCLATISRSLLAWHRDRAGDDRSSTAG